MSGEITRVGVVGAGTMGNGIAQVFAQSGFDVTLIDAADGALERARATIDKSLGKLVEKGKLQADERTASLARIGTGTTVEGLANADFIVEAIYEDTEAKKALFASLDRITRPEVILASNTSSISITTLGAATNASGQGAGHALHEPGAADDARGADPRTGDVERRDGDGVGLVPAPGQDCRRSCRLPGLHRQSRAHADDQRSRLLRDGRRRHAGRDRYRHEARDESSDGTADACRLHRSRRLPRHSRTCCTKDSAIRSTARARSCDGWWRRAISDASPDAGSTPTDIVPT